MGTVPFSTITILHNVHCPTILSECSCSYCLCVVSCSTQLCPEVEHTKTSDLTVSNQKYDLFNAIISSMTLQTYILVIFFKTGRNQEEVGSLCLQDFCWSILCYRIWVLWVRDTKWTRQLLISGSQIFSTETHFLE